MNRDRKPKCQQLIGQLASKNKKDKKAKEKVVATEKAKF